ncbi:LicD family protein [Mediterraneibacter sp. NSJ-55]|uniref:LicD family protein n=1 Tax=Mediterraneibacter hominis TaxID=2763054 RepID=A0A923RRK3_9FIRM|nr:LicD family protein [Mediterraneibacter hominis]MBC5689808.1 LicD family protein [Mediterraneibacter hominis]
MTEEQEGLLKLLKEINVICKENDINFYLAGGSFIGAIRHGGFLPWDDDADIHMTRSSYEKFKNIVNHRIENRLVVSKEEYPEYPQIHPRYMALGSTTILRSTFTTSTPQGQFVDIFILDSIPDDIQKQEKYTEDYNLYLELITEVFIQDSRRSSGLIKKYNRYCRPGKYKDKEAICRKMSKKLFSYPEDTSRHYHIRSPQAPQSIIKKEIFGVPRYVSFEDTFLPVAENAEKLLREAYGADWFEVPEINKVSEHIFIEDQELPYTVYEKSYITRFDTKKHMEDVLERKNIWFRVLNQRNHVNPLTHYIKGMPLIYETECFIKAHEIDLDAWIKAKKYEDLNLLFNSIYKYMEQSHVKYWNVLLAMSESLLYASVYPKVMLGEYSMPKQLMDMYRKERPLSSRLERMYEYAQATESLLESIYTDKDYVLAKEIVEKYIEQMPENIYFARAQIKLLLLEANRENVNDIREKLEKHFLDFPEDPELGKYRGDIYLLCGMEAQAGQCYRREKYLLRNGIELKDLKAKDAFIEENQKC